MLLDSFAAATGLCINYSKSTAVPIHMSHTSAAQCLDTLGCRQESFPQVYLGLPLSVHKLPVSAFLPSLAKADRSLAGWQAGLLNSMGRAVLVNSVLNSQLIYAMCALQIPPGIVAQMDQRHRAFLWNGDRTVSGAQSLIAWEKVCWTKDNGGLGIKDLSLMNICLLLKLLHRLHTAVDSDWASSARLHTCLANLQGDLCGNHWDVLRSLYPLYQAVTTVVIGSGERTSFWYDAWESEESLADRFSVLLSHCVKKSLSVAQINLIDIDDPSLWVSRMSSQAVLELEQVRTILQQTALQDATDIRKGPFWHPSTGSGFCLEQSRSKACLVLYLVTCAMQSSVPDKFDAEANH